jgi:peptidoglycan DL-endopeptidase LytE
LSKPGFRSAFILGAAVLAAAACCSEARAAAGAVTHTVIPGDNLWSLSQRYHVSVAVLEARNHLTDSSILQLGETIVIVPASSTAVRVASVHPTARARRMTARAHRNPAHRVAAVRKGETAVAQPAAHALWIATHTGIAPAPPVPENVLIAQRVMRIESSVTKYALGWVGVPYEWGGTTVSGVDCSGYVQTVFARIGIQLPRTADSQFDDGRAVRLPDLVPGDLVFFETYAAGASHVGIYLGGGRFIHAALDGVRVDRLSEDYYASRYIGARRLIQ